MKLKIELPDKILLSDTTLANQQPPKKGLKKELEKAYRPFLNRYKPLRFHICCETCLFVGEARWHCHCDKSPMNHFNVKPLSVCEHYQPNQGLMLFLAHQHYLNYTRKAAGR